LLLFYRARRTLSLRSAGTFNSLRRSLLLRSWLLLLLNAARFTLFLTTTSLLLNRSLRLLSLHWSRCWWRRLRHLLRRTASASALITHMELLSLRTIGRVTHAHRLREIGTEPRCYRRGAGNDCRVVELSRDSRWNIDLPATPR
jgi:hypothetical protein